MQQTRTVTTLIAAATLAALAGCADTNRTPTPSPPPTTSASPTADPGRHRAELGAMVEAAALNPAQLGVKRPTSEQTTFSLTVPCRVGLHADYAASHYWSYRDSKVDVVAHSVFGFDPQRGADVVAQVKASLSMCQEWIYGDRIRMRPLGDFKVTRSKGVDATLAYCHNGVVISGSTRGDTVYLCDGLVSRASLVASVSTVEVTLAAAQRGLRTALPLAAVALVKAVPAS